MSSLTLNDDLYINITPRGAFYAVQDATEDKTRRLILNILQLEESPRLSAKNLSEICEFETDDAMDLLQRMQKLGLVSGQKMIEAAPGDNLESMLPDLLASLSDTKKVLLAEHSGLYLGVSGFPHEAAEELAAISANLSEVYQRHKGLLQGNLGFRQHAWGLVDAAGNSEVGFWPLYIGSNHFTLIIHGIPQFNRPAFKRLVWLLTRRYG